MPFDSEYSALYARMRELVDADDDIAAEPGTDEPRYFFRPGQAVIHKGDYARLTAQRRLDDFTRLDQPGYSDDPESGAPLPFALLQVRRRPRDARRLVARVRELRFANNDARIGLNHIVSGIPHAGCPAGPAQPAVNPGDPAGTEGAGVTLGVIDTGFWPDHPWLKGRARALSGPRDLEQAGSPLGLQAGHGTHVCGVVLRMAPAATVVVAGPLDENGLSDDRTVAAALARMLRADVKIVNMSLGCYTVDDDPPKALASVVETMPPDAALIAGAGNKASPRPMYPAAFPKAFGVGALDRTGARAGFSNHGDWVKACAPGVGIDSAFFLTEQFADGFARWSGTSFAAPQFAGAVARLVAANPALTPALAAASLVGQVGHSVVGVGTAFQPHLP